MEKIKTTKKYLQLLLDIFSNSDNAYEDEITEETQKNAIDSSDEISAEIKSELKKSLSNVYSIESKYIEDTKKSEKEKLTKAIKVDSMKAVAEAKQKVADIEEEKEIQ